jgi:hypothetical protein
MIFILVRQGKCGGGAPLMQRMSGRLLQVLEQRGIRQVALIVGSCTPDYCFPIWVVGEFEKEHFQSLKQILRWRRNSMYFLIRHFCRSILPFRLIAEFGGGVKVQLTMSGINHLGRELTVLQGVRFVLESGLHTAHHWQ